MSECTPKAILVPQEQPIAVVTQILRGPPGAPGSAGTHNYDSFVPTLGQTSFNLTVSPVINPQLATVFLNGQKLIYLQAFNFTTAFSVLEFISLEYQLEPNDDLEIYYFT